MGRSQYPASFYQTGSAHVFVVGPGIGVLSPQCNLKIIKINQVCFIKGGGVTRGGAARGTLPGAAVNFCRRRLGASVSEARSRQWKSLPRSCE